MQSTCQIYEKLTSQNESRKEIKYTIRYYFEKVNYINKSFLIEYNTFLVLEKLLEIDYLLNMISILISGLFI